MGAHLEGWPARTGRQGWVRRAGNVRSLRGSRQHPVGKNGNEGGRPFSCAGLERKDDIVCTDGVRAMNVWGREEQVRDGCKLGLLGWPMKGPMSRPEGAKSTAMGWNDEGGGSYEN